MPTRPLKRRSRNVPRRPPSRSGTSLTTTSRPSSARSSRSSIDERAAFERRAADLESEIGGLALAGADLTAQAAVVAATLGRAVAIEGPRGQVWRSTPHRIPRPPGPPQPTWPTAATCSCARHCPARAARSRGRWCSWANRPPPNSSASRWTASQRSWRSSWHATWPAAGRPGRRGVRMPCPRTARRGWPS